MPPVPIGTQAGMVRRVLNAPHPRLALPAIASHFGVTLEVLQAVLHEAGYPDKFRMERAALVLEERASQAIADRAEAEETAHDVQPAPLPAEHTTERASGPSVTSEAVSGPDSASQAGRLTLVRVSDLHPDPRNLRQLPSPEDADIIELADSIASAGLLQPIVARRDLNGHLVIVMGHRRYVAVAHRLKWTALECIVRGTMSPTEVLAAMLIENGQRKDLDPISEMRGLLELRKVLAGCSEAALGRHIGRSGIWVASRLDLAHLSERDQDRVRTGDLGIGAATSAVRSQLGTRRGTPGVDRNWHLGPRHSLAEAARALCTAAGHVSGRKLGAIACGECWENTIRSDERRKINAEALAEHDRISDTPVSAESALETADRPAVARDLSPRFVTGKPDAW